MAWREGSRIEDHMLILLRTAPFATVVNSHIRIGLPPSLPAMALFLVSKGLDEDHVEALCYIPPLPAAGGPGQRLPT